MNSNQEEKLSLGEKSGYLYQSIVDLQGTIHSIDIKIAALILILSIPFTVIGKIFSRFCQISVITSGSTQFVCYLLFCVFSILWLVSFIAALQGIIGIDNPVRHIDLGKISVKGSFYNAGLFELPFICILNNSVKCKSFKTLAEQISILPNTKSDLIHELAFEQMKLSYIRDMKLRRQYWAFRLTILWLFTGFGIYLFI